MHPGRRDRAGLLAYIAGATVTVHLAVNAVLGTVTPAAALGAALCLACSATYAALRKSNLLSPEGLFRLGRVLLGVHAFALAGYELMLTGARVEALTLVALQALVVAVIIPMGRVAAWGNALATCLLQPLGAQLAIAFAIVPVQAGDLARSWLGAALMFGVALSTRSVVRKVSMGRAKKTAGGFVLKSKLGTGGMGEVWEAQHTGLACPAAVKIISVAQDDVGVERFQREARATAMLTSIHTVRLYDYGVMSDGRPYYAMELLNGFDLERMVGVGGPLAPARVVFLMKQVCDSLAEAHAAGLVHRDIKPANLFVAHLGGLFDVIKVVDFGLVAIGPSVRAAAEIELLTGPAEFTGTPAYYPPELTSGVEADARSDIYQMGCVMFYLLTGEVLFSGETPMVVVMKHVTEAARRPSDVRGSAVPPDLDNLVSRCLAKAPSDRPGSARKLLEELEGLACAEEWSQKAARRWWEEFAVFPEPNVETSSRKLGS